MLNIKIKKTGKIMLTCLKTIFYIFLCAVILILFLLTVYDYLDVVSNYSSYSNQFKIYMFCNSIIIILWIVLLFVKITFIKKIIIFILSLFFLHYIDAGPELRTLGEYNLCYENGICVEGLQIKLGTDKAETVNKNNCLKYNYVWQDNKCYLRYKK